MVSITTPALLRQLLFHRNSLPPEFQAIIREEGVKHSARAKAAALRADVEAEGELIGFGMIHNNFSPEMLIILKDAAASAVIPKWAQRAGGYDSEAVRVYNLTFVKGLRDRTGEDGVASAIVLNTLAEASELEGRLNLELDSSEQLLSDAEIYEDPVAALLAGHVESATVYPDGGMTADGRFRGGVLPGSFNPLHQGHELLADAASDIIGADVAYELSVTNVDKPPLEEAEVRRRVAQFVGKRPLVLTSAPVFYEKARVLRDCTFVLGWDTATRLVDPKYYGGSQARMLMALEEMGRLGCSFLVAGRLDNGTFRTIDDIDLPDDLRHLFSGIPESRFRSDISSTEMRMADPAG
ncbi:MAG: hypothetical protein IIC21_02965 [Chloroflexi bacterium]|nr:hypothetical protein [Chloroflexota bacterium]